MKRFIGVLGLAVLAVAVTAASAMAAPAPKATGDYGYSFGGVQRHVTFNAIQSSTDTCGVFWNVEGVHQFDFFLNGDPNPGTDYLHHASLTQNGLAVSGSGGYPFSGGDQYHWNVTSGSVVGNALQLTVDYDLGAVGTTMHMNGTIASNGSISGTWSDNLNRPGADRTGTFTAPAGSATAMASYCGKGTFSYSDEQGNWYLGAVKTVSVSGNQAWYAVQILASNLGYESSPTNYLFVNVTDNGEPGIGKDVTAGDLMTPAAATSAVAGHLTPSTSAVINQGNIQVH
jgi:hypothetical protein